MSKPEAEKSEIPPVDSGESAPEQAQVAAPEDLLQVRLKTLEEQAASAKDQMLRALAEAENTRRRAVKDREDATKYAVTNFARDMLDYADNFSRAMESIPAEMKTAGTEPIKSLVAGLEAMERNLLQTMEKYGIRKVDPLGEPFNPNFHEVMFEIPGSGKPAGTIMQVVSKGYMIHDRLLRPARVGIAKDEGQGGSEGPRKVDTQA